jgi:hypothetical protein
MGKRQRARLRLEPSTATFAGHVKRIVLDGEVGVLVSLDEIRDAQAEAERVAGKLAGITPPPTPLEMMARSMEDVSRLEFELFGRAWRKRDGKEGVVFEIKFDALGNPTYRFQLANGARSTHPAATVHDVWSQQRVYFLVDENTGRRVAPAVA